MSAPAVDVRDVTVTLADTTALDGVDLAVERGRLVGVVGPNGAGKTTLLRTVNGRLAPDVGSVDLDGTPVSTLSARQLGQRVATVPQSGTVPFEFTVREVVEMGRHPHRHRFGFGDHDVGAVDRALERTDTAHLADRSIAEVSGGERQRVVLARALAQTTPLLLLDEPTASLDINHQIRTLEIVRELVDAADRTALAAIHDLDLAARYCDELVLLAAGRIEATGPPEAVLIEPRLEATFGISTAVWPNPITGSRSVTAVSTPPIDLDVPVHVVAGGGSGVGVLARLTRAGYAVTVGPVHERDPEVTTARSLELEAVTSPAFSAIDDGAVDRAIDRIRRAAVTVVTDIEIGAMNAVCLDAADAADRLVVVEDRPFEARNHLGAAGRRRYHRLRDRARVTDTEHVVDAVEAALGAVDGAPPSPTPSESDSG